MIYQKDFARFNVVAKYQISPEVAIKIGKLKWQNGCRCVKSRIYVKRNTIFSPFLTIYQITLHCMIL